MSQFEKFITKTSGYDIFCSNIFLLLGGLDLINLAATNSTIKFFLKGAAKGDKKIARRIKETFEHLALMEKVDEEYFYLSGEKPCSECSVCMEEKVNIFPDPFNLLIGALKIGNCRLVDQYFHENRKLKRYPRFSKKGTLLQQYHWLDLIEKASHLGHLNTLAYLMGKTYENFTSTFYPLGFQAESDEIDSKIIVLYETAFHLLLTRGEEITHKTWAFKRFEEEFFIVYSLSNN